MLVFAALDTGIESIHPPIMETLPQGVPRPTYIWACFRYRQQQALPTSSLGIGSRISRYGRISATSTRFASPKWLVPRRPPFWSFRWNGMPRFAMPAAGRPRCKLLARSSDCTHSANVGNRGHPEFRSSIFTAFASRSRARPPTAARCATPLPRWALFAFIWISTCEFFSKSQVRPPSPKPAEAAQQASNQTTHRASQWEPKYGPP